MICSEVILACPGEDGKVIKGETSKVDEFKSYLNQCGEKMQIPGVRREIFRLADSKAYNQALSVWESLNG